MTARKGSFPHGCHTGCPVSGDCVDALSSRTEGGATGSSGSPELSCACRSQTHRDTQPGVWLLDTEHMGVLDTCGHPRVRWGPGFNGDD